MEQRGAARWAYKRATTAERDAVILSMPPEAHAAFWKRVSKGKGCWTFDKIDTHGYGIFRFGGYVFKAHRVSKVAAEQVSHHDKMVCHRCNNKSCVRPDHTYWGDYGQNLRDRNASKVDFYRCIAGEKSRHAKLTTRQVVKIWNSYHFDNSRMSHLAKEFGVGDAVINAIISRRTWKRVTATLGHPRTRDGVASGHHQGLAKLTDDKVLAIRAAVAAGHLKVSQARLYGVTKTTITHIINRKTWRHL